MTREGIIVCLYTRKIEARPFSRFTDNAEEREANDEWRTQALEWGSKYEVEHGLPSGYMAVEAMGRAS